jgi:hypothetical protein
MIAATAERVMGQPEDAARVRSRADMLQEVVTAKLLAAE